MAAPPKPFRVEYAKSNRSTCKMCQCPIGKDTLRIAKVVPATQFDGYMTVWHHAACIFKKPGRIELLDDVEGIDNLRWKDHQKLRNYIEDRSSNTNAEGVNEMDSDNKVEDGENAIENAKSSRAACKICNEKIEKGEVRISKMQTGVGNFRGKVPVWHHAKCFLEMGWWQHPIAEMPGWEGLSVKDQKVVKSLLKQDLVGTRKKSESSNKGSKAVKEPESVSGQKNLKQRKRKGQDESSLVNEGLTKSSEGQNKRARKGRDTAQVDINSENTNNNEKQLEKQSKALWDIKDSLKKNVSTAELRMMLEENGQDSSGSEYDLRERCADGMLFGALGRCPTCDGPLEYPGGQYRCRGNISEWSKCSYTTLSPQRLKGKWKIPEESESDYLRKWFKSQPSKREKRLLLANSSGKQAMSKLAEGSEKKKKQVNNGGGGPLEGLRLSILGNNTKATWEQFIEATGGPILKDITSDTHCVIINETELELEEHRTKLQQALSLQIPVVKEEFIRDCLEKGALLPVDQYILETAGKLASMMKVKVKGRSAVHEESGLQDVGHILEDGKTIFNTTLNLSDLSTGINSYYILQIIEHDNKNVHHLFRRWGRVGNAKIGSFKIEKMSKAAAISEFKRLFQEKTGNDWKLWEAKAGFKKQPNKFYPLEIDYGVEKAPQDVKSMGSKSKLDPRVISLMKMLFDIETYRAAMMEFEINMSEMPLGKLSKRNIEQGFQVLTEIQNLLGSSEKKESLLIDASNRFFTLIPHVHPHIISTEETLKKKIEMLEALRDIEIASKLIGSTVEDTDEDPLDLNYNKLYCNIVPIPHDGKDFQLIKKYLERTHASTHKDWGLQIEDVYAIEREGEGEAFTSQKEKLANRMLLWHGSRTTNFVGILSQGLRIAPPEAPVTGYMFGKGIYFADLVSKSAQYCYTSKQSPIGLMLLSEVALGEMYELKEAKYMEKPPAGKHSTKGVGKNVPLHSEYETWGDQVTVPCGCPVPSGVRSTSLLYNEYIVYDTTQVNLRFLLKVRFNHKR